MSHVQDLRHAIDAARAGNPALARIHLQKAAAVVPDEPAVWLWMSWLADSPLSMVQCLELLKRHEDYVDVAESGLAFARALARFDYETMSTAEPNPPSAAAVEQSSDGDIDKADDSESTLKVEEESEATLDPSTEAATETQPTENDEDESSDQAAAVDMTPQETEIASPSDPTECESAFASDTADSPHTTESELKDDDTIDSAAALEADSPDAAEDDAAEIDQFQAREANEPEEEATDESSGTLWDGIALLSRTADAIADELKADSTTADVEETLSFPDPDFDVDLIHPAMNEGDDSREGVFHEGHAEQQPAGEGNSWFDYWLPEGERKTEAITEADAVDEHSPAESERAAAEPVALDSTDSDETEAANPDEDDETASREPMASTQDDSLTDDAAAAREVKPPARVLEIVDESPFQATEPIDADAESNADDTSANGFESPAEPEAGDSTGSEARRTEQTAADDATTYVPPVAQQSFEIPPELTSPELPPPPQPEQPAENSLAAADSFGSSPQADPWTAPAPAQKPADVWRGAQSNWFNADGSGQNTSLVPHEAASDNGVGLPARVPHPLATAPAATSGSASAGHAPPPVPGQLAVRPANQSIFDAEPTPPALIEPGPSPPFDGAASVEPSTGLVAAGPSENGDAVTETAIGQPVQNSNGADSDETQSEAGQPKRPQPKIDSSDRRTILVVDDSPTVRKLVEMSLQRNGFRVVHAFDGVAAIKEIARQNPALILMDVNMPRLDGYQLCKLVRKHDTTRHIPVVMLTGKEGVFDKLRGRLVGCSGYIAKPFSPEELVRAVEHFLSEPAPI